MLNKMKFLVICLLLALCPMMLASCGGDEEVKYGLETIFNKKYETNDFAVVTKEIKFVGTYEDNRGVAINPQNDSFLMVKFDIYTKKAESATLHEGSLLLKNRKGVTITGTKPVYVSDTEIGKDSKEITAFFDVKVEELGSKAVYLEVDLSSFSSGVDIILNKPVPASHTHIFVEGICACGEMDPEYKPHEHVFVEGKCECGEVDPEYVVPEVHEHVACEECGKCTAEDCTGTEEEKCPGHEEQPEHEHVFVEGKCECGAEEEVLEPEVPVE